MRATVRVFVSVIVPAIIWTTFAYVNPRPDSLRLGDAFLLGSIVIGAGMMAYGFHAIAFPYSWSNSDLGRTPNAARRGTAKDFEKLRTMPARRVGWSASLIGKKGLLDTDRSDRSCWAVRSGMP